MPCRCYAIRCYVFSPAERVLLDMFIAPLSCHAFRRYAAFITDIVLLLDYFRLYIASPIAAKMSRHATLFAAVDTPRLPPLP